MEGVRDVRWHRREHFLKVNEAQGSSSPFEER
jgi:hypothetical protein